MRCLSRTDKKKLQAIIAANIEKLRAIPGFVGVRPGFPIVDGRVVKQPAIVVYVTVPLDPSHRRCGKTNISRDARGKHGGRFSLQRSMRPDVVVVLSPTRDA